MLCENKVGHGIREGKAQLPQALLGPFPRGNNLFSGWSTFNTQRNLPLYVGYMYGSTGASSYSATHANTNSSTIKTTVDNWYKTNIVDAGYSDKVADVIYCNDRQIDTVSGYGNALGYGTNQTAYMPRCSFPKKKDRRS